MHFLRNEKPTESDKMQTEANVTSYNMINYGLYCMSKTHKWRMVINTHATFEVQTENCVKAFRSRGFGTEFRVQLQLEVLNPGRDVVIYRRVLCQPGAPVLLGHSHLPLGYPVDLKSSTQILHGVCRNFNLKF